MRWALIYTVQFTIPVIRTVSEDRVAAWEDCGWTLLLTETAIHDQAIEDVRNDEERGKR